MVHSIPVSQADGILAQLLRDLGPDDEIGLTSDGILVARIIPEYPSTTDRRPGACKGMIDLLDDGDDDILEQFQAYLP
jgi:antitoxin (DNA-binding transcriptional repressor) of toxin-antitoxin stability system